MPLLLAAKRRHEDEPELPVWIVSSIRVGVVFCDV